LGLITEKLSVSTFIRPGPSTSRSRVRCTSSRRPCVHCSGVVQWWACSSLMAVPLPAEGS